VNLSPSTAGRSNTDWLPHKRHEAETRPYFNNKSGLPKPFYRYSTLGDARSSTALPKINESGNKLFFFYSIDDTRLKDVQPLRQYTMPTALERAGDFSQTRTPSGALVVVTDPLTGQPFPGNRFPANRIDPRGVALLNVFRCRTRSDNPPTTTTTRSRASTIRGSIWCASIASNNSNTISGNTDLITEECRLRRR
jgi:hypothetical protein